jgi:tRNA modification GTPase
MAPLSTIAALATGPAPGGVGILRVSGPEALLVARTVARGLPAEPAARRAYLVRLEDGRGGLLDEGLALHFPAPHSYTGEDVVELHAHGSPRLLSLLLSALLATGRARLAEPGEFTRRAFLNGRLELQRAEAVADLVAAESEAAVRAAAAQVAGALSGRLSPCLETLRGLHADLEAVLAFPDEAEGAEAGLLPRVRAAAAAVEALATEAARGRVVRRGARVVLVGPPNAGKSTLFNRLLGEERALVDDAPGTTRDALEARLELNGLAVTLVDTAGLREAPGRLEAMGVARARRELASADLVLLLLPPGEEPAPWQAELPPGTPWLQLRGKADVGGGQADAEPCVTAASGAPGGLTGRDVVVGAGGPFQPGMADGSKSPKTGGEMSRAPRPAGAPGVSDGPRVPGEAEAVGGGRGRKDVHVPGVSRGAESAGGSSAVNAPPAGDSQGLALGAAPRGEWVAVAGEDAPPSTFPARCEQVLPVSGLTGEGVDALFEAVCRRLLGEGTPGAVAFATERHAECVARAAAHLSQAVLAAEVSTLEVVAGEVGLGLHALLDITGEDAGEALLDDIFRRFCIGK